MCLSVRFSLEHDLHFFRRNNITAELTNIDFHLIGLSTRNCYPFRFKTGLTKKILIPWDVLVALVLALRSIDTEMEDHLQ
jgi:hypothetical protein